MGLESIQGTEVPTEDFDAKYSGRIQGPKSGARRYFPGIETWNLHLGRLV
jgi:hypothetical protein